MNEERVDSLRVGFISAFLSFGYNLGTALLGLACAGIVGIYGIVKGIFKK